MVSTRSGAFLIACVALYFSSAHVLASDKPVAIDTIPPGAQVEVNGNVTCNTPCSINVPSYYFGRKHTALSAHGVNPIRVTLTKEGYAAKSVDLTTGPIHWSSLNGVNSYDYYLVSSEHFTFQLEAVGGAPAVVPPIETKISAPPSSSAIVVASPSGVSPNQIVEFNESSLIIRGVATDSAGILLVTINGSTANMRPQSAQAAEFWSEPMQIKPGNTPIEITASNSAHVETRLAFAVHYTPKAAAVNPRALSKQEIVSLLKGDVPSARIENLIEERGIKFTPTTDDLREIRRAGGSEELIQKIQEAAPPE